MGDDEVLAAGLANEPGVAAIARDVLPDRAPQVLERPGGAGEVDPGQVRAGQCDLGDRPAAAGHHVDHPGRQPGRLEQAHQVVSGQLLGGGRLPDHDIAEQGGCGRQVAGDRREVERRDREHESLERAVLEPVPRAGRRPRLLGQQPPGVVHVVPPEVDQLAGGVDLGLVRGLGLAEDGSRVDGGAPRPGQQVGGAQEDGRAVVKGQLAPPWRGPPRGLDGRRHVLLGRVAEPAEHVPVVVRLDHVDAIAGTHPVLAADRHGQLGLLPCEFLDPVLQSGALSAARGILPTGSFTGTGTFVTASNTACSLRYPAPLPACRIIDAQERAAGSAGHVAEFLGRVPEQFVAFGAVDGEPRIVVAIVGGGQRRDRRADVPGGADVVDVAGNHVPERDRHPDFYERGLVKPGDAGHVLVWHFGREHHPALRSARVGVQQPQRGPGRERHRDVLEFLVVAAGVPLPQRGRDGEAAHWRRTSLGGGEQLGQRRHGERQVDAHWFPAEQRRC